MLELPPPENDGLFIPTVGSWSKEKHHYLRRYIDIFTVGMKNKPWTLHYIDLFAGAGIERLDNAELDWGSPLIAAQAPNPFGQLHLCDNDRTKLEALRQRIGRFRQPHDPQIIEGDANQAVEEIVAAIPTRGQLSLAFLDPYGLHLHFETLRCLAQRKVDLLIFFPDHLDALRNWKIYLKKEDSNLDRFLGTSVWRSIGETAPPTQWAAKLRNLYEDRLRLIGFQYFDSKRIQRSDGVPLYQLLFCSEHERGGEFFRKISRKDASGQISFDF